MASGRGIGRRRKADADVKSGIAGVKQGVKGGILRGETKTGVQNAHHRSGPVVRGAKHAGAI